MKISALKSAILKYKGTRAARIILALLIIGLVVAFLSRIFLDMECASENIFQRGPRVFSWLKKIPGLYAPHSIPEQLQQELFPEGKISIDPLCVTQGAVYDCRFLASVSSLSSTEKGKQMIMNMIKQQDNGSFTVTFPGDRAAPVTVSALTPQEIYLYAHAKTFKGKENGSWLQVLEKAYGQYRNNHQDAEKLVTRSMKHLLLEGRATPISELPGYGAAYGASDDNALMLLTGGTVTDVPTSSKEIGEFGLGKGYVTWRQVRSWADRQTVVGEFLKDEDEALKDAFGHGYPVIAATELASNPETYGVRSHHAYSVVGYDAKNKMLHIRDVMGPAMEFWDPDSKIPYDKIRDGNFSIALIDYDKLFSHLHIGRY